MSLELPSETESKHQVIFLTEDEANKPSTVTLEENKDAPPGLIFPDGSINWNCPCLGGMATGPCGPEFREAFSCFHYSEEEPKGKDCLPKFAEMQECMKQYPELYDERKEEKDKVTTEENKTEENKRETEVASAAEAGIKVEVVTEPEAEPSSVKENVVVKEDLSEPTQILKM